MPYITNNFCADCRADVGQAHHPNCPRVRNQIPFEVQAWLLKALQPTAIMTIKYDLLEKFDALVNLSQDRHAEGFVQYGDEMYLWTPEERLKNVMEEIADAITYLTSGPIE